MTPATPHPIRRCCNRAQVDFAESGCTSPTAKANIGEKYESGRKVDQKIILQLIIYLQISNWITVGFSSVTISSKAISTSAWGGLLGFHEFQAPRIYRHPTHKGGRIVIPRHQPPLLPEEIFLVFIYVRSWSDPGKIAEPAGFSQTKIPITPLGKETSIFRFVAQRNTSNRILVFWPCISV